MLKGDRRNAWRNVIFRFGPLHVALHEVASCWIGSGKAQKNKPPPKLNIYLELQVSRTLSQLTIR